MYCFQHGACQHQHEGHGGSLSFLQKLHPFLRKKIPMQWLHLGMWNGGCQGHPPPLPRPCMETLTLFLGSLMMMSDELCGCCADALPLSLQCLAQPKVGACSFGFRGLWSDGSSDTSISTWLHRAQLSR